jgi:putative oligomerization/nucleic acid binding protein
MAEASERARRRQQNFARQQERSPLPVRPDDLPLPGGGLLDEDEFVVRTAKDWHVSIKPLLLTTRRLICPHDPSGREVATILLEDVREVSLRKHWIGYATLAIEVGDDRKGFFPAHSNGAQMRADIATMVTFAKNEAARRAEVLPSAVTGDRYEQLRKIGALKESGVLSDAEFEEEKARILKQP